MKKIILLFCILSFGFLTASIAQTVSIPDAAFLNFLKAEYPSAINGSDQLIIAQASTFNGDLNCSNLGITNLEGIQYFTNIQFLHANNNNITSLPDISAMNKIETFDLKDNDLNTLPSLENQTLLTKIFISNNQLTKIPPLTNNTNLIQLIAFSNQLDSLPMLNHLTKLNKIDVGNNRLKELPDMSNLVKMEQLLIWHNLLDSVPDLKNYPNLWRFNAGGNKLSYTPDFSWNPRLKILFLDDNQLTLLPNLSFLDSLDDVRFQNNNFDFLNLSPILSYPGNDTIFDYTPQHDFPGGAINVFPNDTLTIPSSIAAFATSSYKWYYNGTLIATTNAPVLKKYPALAGEYYVRVTSTAFPGLTLKTDSFHVTTNTCIDLSGITFDIDGIRCLKAGELWINSVSLPTGNYSYQLKGTVTHKTHSSTSGKFQNLTEPKYTLTISNGTCNIVFPSLITIPSEACEETFITPNGDGDKDSYFFNQTGNVIIYDKQGRKIKSLTLPEEWDGTGADGKLVSPGYYISNINDGESLVNISVIY